MKSSSNLFIVIVHRNGYNLLSLNILDVRNTVFWCPGSVCRSVYSTLSFFLVYVSQVRDRGMLSSVLIWFYPAFHIPTQPSAPSLPSGYVYAYLYNNPLLFLLYFNNFYQFEGTRTETFPNSRNFSQSDGLRVDIFEIWDWIPFVCYWWTEFYFWQENYSVVIGSL